MNLFDPCIRCPHNKSENKSLNAALIIEINKLKQQIEIIKKNAGLFQCGDMPYYSNFLCCLCKNYDFENYNEEVCGDCGCLNNYKHLIWKDEL